MMAISWIAGPGLLVVLSSGSPHTLTRLPIGSSSGKNVRANASLTRTTGGAPSSSSARAIADRGPGARRVSGAMSSPIPASSRRATAAGPWTNGGCTLSGKSMSLALLAGTAACRQQRHRSHAGQRARPDPRGGARTAVGRGASGYGLRRAARPSSSGGGRGSKPSSTCWSRTKLRTMIAAADHEHDRERDLADTSSASCSRRAIATGDAHCEPSLSAPCRSSTPRARSARARTGARRRACTRIAKQQRASRRAWISRSRGADDGKSGRTTVDRPDRDEHAERAAEDAEQRRSR